MSADLNVLAKGSDFVDENGNCPDCGFQAGAQPHSCPSCHQYNQSTDPTYDAQHPGVFGNATKWDNEEAKTVPKWLSSFGVKK